jgi:hypothetical protein
MSVFVVVVAVGVLAGLAVMAGLTWWLMGPVMGVSVATTVMRSRRRRRR